MFFSSDFLDALYGFNEQSIELDGSDTFIEVFLPGRGFHFSTDWHEFHIFYFNDEYIYLTDYYAEFGRDNFGFTCITKDEVIEFIKEKIIINFSAILMVLILLIIIRAI